MLDVQPHCPPPTNSCKSNDGFARVGREKDHEVGKESFLIKLTCIFKIHDISPNQTSKMDSFDQMVYGSPPKMTIDLVWPKPWGVNIAAEHRVEKMIAIRKDIKQQLEASSAKYKATYKHCHKKIFSESDQIMVQIRK